MTEIDDRYKRGKIYTIRNIEQPELVYVGSTINPLASRFCGHKDACKKFKVLNPKSRCFYRLIENNDWSDWYIELYELFPCNNKQELTKREGDVMKEIGNLNIKIEGRTKQEYYQDNREQLLEQRMQYRQDNREQLLENQQQYYQDNRERLLEYQKQYQQANREQLLERQNKYRQDNKAKIAEQKKQKYQAKKLAKRLAEQAIL